jgi:hypothetical protein
LHLRILAMTNLLPLEGGLGTPTTPVAALKIPFSR